MKMGILLLSVFTITLCILAGSNSTATRVIVTTSPIGKATGTSLPLEQPTRTILPFPTLTEVIDADYEAQANGKPSVLTYTNNISIKDQNGKDAMSGYPPRTGYDCHEYPYKSTYKGGKGASVRYVNPGDNQDHGAYLSNFYRQQGNQDGFRFYVDSGYYPWSSLPTDYYNVFGYEVSNSNQGGDK